MNLRDAVAAVSVAALLAGVFGAGCGSSGKKKAATDGGCTTDASASVLSIDAGTAACQACVRTSCAAKITACENDCVCNELTRSALACVEELAPNASATSVTSCVAGLATTSNAALTQVGTCLATCVDSCTGTSPVTDAGTHDAPGPMDAPAEAQPEAGAEGGADTTTDAAAEASTDAPGAEVLLENPDGGSGPAFPIVESTIGGTAREGALGDFDGDGILDLAIAGSDSTSAAGAIIALGDGKGHFSYETTLTGMGNTPEGIVVGKFNNDAFLDVVVAGFSEGPYIAYGKGDGTFQPAVSLAFSGEGGGGGLVGAGDFNGDGFLDLAVGYDGGMFVLFNNKVGGFATTPVLANNQVVFNRFAVGDLNGDTFADLGYGDNTLYVVYGSAVSGAATDGGAGGFTVNHVAGSSTNTRNVAFGDLDKNGHLDVIGSMSQGSPSPIEVTLQRTNGTFQPEVGYGATVDQPPVIGDFDGDTNPDVAASSTTSSSMVFFHGVGDGTLMAPASYALPGVPAFIVTGDVNKDGNPDIVAVSAGNTVTTFLGVTP